jgi:hypothetical protein
MQTVSVPETPTQTDAKEAIATLVAFLKSKNGNYLEETVRWDGVEYMFTAECKRRK